MLLFTIITNKYTLKTTKNRSLKKSGLQSLFLATDLKSQSNKFNYTLIFANWKQILALCSYYLSVLKYFIVLLFFNLKKKKMSLIFMRVKCIIYCSNLNKKLCFQFVAHPNVQQLLASIWYEGLPGFRRKNMMLQAFEIVRIGILFPFFSIAYIIAPHSVIGQTMRKPFIKFICHSASYFTFLCKFLWLKILYLMLMRIYIYHHNGELVRE